MTGIVFVKFSHIILTKIIKIVATRCQILRQKLRKFNFGSASALDPAGGAYSASPDPLAGFKGPTSKGKGKGGRGGVSSTFFCGSTPMVLTTTNDITGFQS